MIKSYKAAFELFTAALKQMKQDSIVKSFDMVVVALLKLGGRLCCISSALKHCTEQGLRVWLRVRTEKWSNIVKSPVIEFQLPYSYHLV